MAWEAGFDDTLDHREITQITHRLFAYHIGAIVTPIHGSVSDRAALDNLLRPSVEYANILFGEPMADDYNADNWEQMQSLFCGVAEPSHGGWVSRRQQSSMSNECAALGGMFE